MDNIKVYVEIGEKRAIAAALDWPGWCRGGRSETAALQALADYAPRYAQVLRMAQVDFAVPIDSQALVVVERLKGNKTTDYGVPNLVAEADRGPFDRAEFERLRGVLQACWLALDGAARAATGKELRKGPRGGGRELEEILRHVLDADVSYLGRLGWRGKYDSGRSLDEEFRQARQAILDGLEAGVRGELPGQGPRGGTIWPPRYFVRRSAWHVLDHAWEIEDRIA